MKWLLILTCVVGCGRLSFDPQRETANDAATPLDAAGPVEIIRFTGEAIYLTVDTNNVYWTGNDAVRQCPLTGCTSPRVLATNQPGANGIAVNATTVAWTNYIFQNGSTVASCAIDGCNDNPTILGSNLTPFEIVLDGSTAYWTNFNQQTIQSCPVTGCNNAPTTLASNVTNAWGIAYDATTLYFTQDTGAGRIQSCAKSGCASPSLVIDSQVNPSEIAVDGADLYWCEAGLGRIHRCAIADCAGTDTLLATSQDNPRFLAIDATNVYWNSGGTSVRACAKTGCVAPTILAEDQAGLSGIAVDAAAVYWGKQNAIVRLRK